MSTLQQAALLVMGDQQLAKLVRKNSELFAEAIKISLNDDDARDAILESMSKGSTFDGVLDNLYSNYTRRTLDAVVEATGESEETILAYVAANPDSYQEVKSGQKTYIEKLGTSDPLVSSGEPVAQSTDETDPDEFFETLGDMFGRFSKRSVGSVARETEATQQEVLDFISESPDYDISHGRSNTYIVRR